MEEVIDKRVGGAKGVGNLEDGEPNAKLFGNLLAEAQRLSYLARGMRAGVLTQQPGAAEVAPELPVKEVKDAPAPEPPVEEVEEGGLLAAQEPEKEAGVVGEDEGDRLTAATEPPVESVASPDADAGGGVEVVEEAGFPEEEAPKVTTSAPEADLEAPAGELPEAEPEEVGSGIAGDDGESGDESVKKAPDAIEFRPEPVGESDLGVEPPVKEVSSSEVKAPEGTISAPEADFEAPTGGLPEAEPEEVVNVVAGDGGESGDESAEEEVNKSSRLRKALASLRAGWGSFFGPSAGSAKRETVKENNTQKSDTQLDAALKEAQAELATDVVGGQQASETQKFESELPEDQGIVNIGMIERTTRGGIVSFLSFTWNPRTKEVSRVRVNEDGVAVDKSYPNLLGFSSLASSVDEAKEKVIEYIAEQSKYFKFGELLEPIVDDVVLHEDAPKRPRVLEGDVLPPEEELPNTELEHALVPIEGLGRIDMSRLLPHKIGKNFYTYVIDEENRIYLVKIDEHGVPLDNYKILMGDRDSFEAAKAWLQTKKEQLCRFSKSRQKEYDEHLGEGWEKLQEEIKEIEDKIFTWDGRNQIRNKRQGYNNKKAKLKRELINMDWEFQPDPDNEGGYKLVKTQEKQTKGKK